MESARHEKSNHQNRVLRLSRILLLMFVCAWSCRSSQCLCLAQSRYPQAQRSFVQLPPGGQLLTTPSMSAPHSPVVQAVMQPRYRMTVRQRHSQLLVTRLPVRRLAVTDSSICNYYQYSPTEVAVVGLGTGTTDLMIWFQGQTSPAIYEVSVVPDDNLEQQHGRRLGALQAGVSQLFPRSQISLIPIGNQVILKGQAFDTREAQQILKIVRAEVQRITGPARPLEPAGPVVRASHTSAPETVTDVAGLSDPVVNLLEIPGEFNVRMRVIIAEVSRTQLRDLGHSLNVTFNDGSRGIGASVGRSSGCSLSGIFNQGELSAFVRWLKTNRSVTLLAEPTIVCMSGHSASLLAGGEFAVPTVLGLDGGQTTSFRGVGTSMLVTPTVTDRDLIRLKIEPEFSALDGTHVNGVPGTSVKRVHTTVELREGQTLALAGLISRRTQAEVSRPPLLSRIPLIGRALLQNKRASEEEVELLVLVTPEIVRGMEPDEVPPLPGDFLTQPSDHDLFYHGRTEGPPDSQPRQRWTFGSGQMPGLPLGYSLSDMSAPRHVLGSTAAPRAVFPQTQAPTTVMPRAGRQLTPPQHTQQHVPQPVPQAAGSLPALPPLSVPDRQFLPASPSPYPGTQR